MRRLIKIVGVAVFVIFVGGAAGYWFLLHTSAKPGAAIVNTPVSTPGPLEGTWSVSPGIGADDASASWIGYRVNEHLVGITNTIVGRSRAVTGAFTVHGTSASEISVKALAAKLMTNKALRDNSVRKRARDEEISLRHVHINRADHVAEGAEGR